MNALAALASRFDSVAAKALIADKLKDGLIRAKTEMMWVSHEKHLSLAPKDHEDAEVVNDAIIVATVWRSNGHWKSDRDLWRLTSSLSDWASNHFHGAAPI